jgi:hypothetical protein
VKTRISSVGHGHTSVEKKICLSEQEGDSEVDTSRMMTDLHNFGFSQQLQRFEENSLLKIGSSASEASGLRVTGCDTTLLLLLFRGKGSCNVTLCRVSERKHQDVCAGPPLTVCLS